MSFKTSLILEGTEYPVLNTNFSISQNTDHRSGKPSTDVIPGTINLEIELSAENVAKLWQWGVSSNSKKSGSLKFFKFDEDASMFELKFEDGFCTGFSAHTSAVSSSPMTASLTISARKIEIDGDGIELIW